MTNLHNLTVAELRKVVAIKERIEALQSEMDSVIGAAPDAPEAPEAAGNGRRKKRRHMSASARARIGAAQRKRWAKTRRAGKAASRAAAPAEKKKRKVSRAVRARLSAIAKARWARVRESGESKL